MLKETLVPAVAPLHVAAGAFRAFGQGHSTKGTQPGDRAKLQDNLWDVQIGVGRLFSAQKIRFSELFRVYVNLPASAKTIS